MAEDIKNNIDSKPAKTGEGVSQNVSEGNSINSMLNKPMPPKPPAPPTVLNKPAAGTAKKTDNTSDKKASIASAAKKVAQAKKIIDRKSYKAPDKKKSLLVGIFAFMLAGGAIFIMMIMMGTKDIKNQDARMNFSYSNVLAGAVAPLFEALGVTDADSANLEATRKRIASRDPDLFALTIDDWVGKKESPSLKIGSFGNKTSSGSRVNSYSSSEPAPRADFGMGGGGFSGGGGSSQTSGTGRSGSNSFASSSVKNAIDFKNGDKSAGQSLPAMKGKNAINTLTASRKMLSGALTSGSANVARSNWNASFGQGQARATGGSTSGFNNGKIDKSAFKDANAVALDRIESGEIMNLKGLADADKSSVPSANVPKALNPDNIEEAIKKNGDSTDKLIAQTLGGAASDALSGGSSDSSNSSEGVPAGDAVLGEKNTFTPPSEYSSLIENDKDSVYCPEGCGDDHFFYKDNPVTYEKTKSGFIMAVFEGQQMEIDDNGKPVPGTEATYKDKYLINPKGNPKFVHLFSNITDSNGKTTTSYREQL